MNIRDFGNRNRSTDSAVVAAGEMLEREGQEFGLNFGVYDAVEKASQMVIEDIESQLDLDGVLEWRQVRAKFEEDSYL